MSVIFYSRRGAGRFRIQLGAFNKAFPEIYPLGLQSLAVHNTPLSGCILSKTRRSVVEDWRVNSSLFIKLCGNAE